MWILHNTEEPGETFEVTTDTVPFVGMLSRLAPDHEWRLALSAGQKLMAPAPIKGLEWLKSLPIGTMRSIRVVESNEPFVVTETGICWLKYDTDTDEPQHRGWEEVVRDNYCWLATACPETCPAWTPEEEQ